MSILTRVAKVTVGPLCVLVAMAAPPAIAYEDIVVTARKVDESLQDVPLAITALSSQTIERAGIQDLSDIAAFTPGLSFFSPIGEFLPTPIIRGVAQTDIFGETNVASYVDGVYVAGREGLNFNFLDVERIEVVKGPQSTLYGRNAFSGAINYVTKAAPDSFEIKTDLTAGNDGRLAGRIILGGPLLGEQLKGVVSASYDDFDGSYDDNIGNSDVGGRKYETYFGKLEWRPGDNLDVTGSLYYSDDKIDISSTASLPTNCQDIADPRVDPSLPVDAPDNILNTPPTPRYGAFCGDIPDLNTLNTRLAKAGYPSMAGSNTINKVKAALGEDRELTRANINVNWDQDFGTITWLSGYSKTEQTGVDDGSRNLGNLQPYEYCPGGSFACVNYAGVEQAFSGLIQPAGTDETTEWSTELRYTSSQDEPLRGGGGFYYFDSSFNASSKGSVIASAGLPPGYDIDASRFGPFVGENDLFAGAIPIGTGAFGPWFSENGDTDSSSFNASEDTKSWASFGFLELDFLERFTARAEVRYTYQEQKVSERTRNNTGPGCPGPDGLGCPDLSTNPADGDFTPDGVAFNYSDIKISDDGDWDFWTGRLSLQFRPNEDWMLYTSVANGTKSGFLEIVQEDTLQALPDDEACVGKDANGDPTIFNDQVCRAIPVSNEKNTSYEIGAKGAALDGRLQMEIIGFYTDWGDAAIRSTIDRVPGSGVVLEQPAALTQIAGSAEIKGWETSLSFAPDEFWVFSAGLAYTDAKWEDATLDSLINFPDYGGGGADCLPVSGETLPSYCGRVDDNQVARQPPWQGSLSAQFTTPVGLNILDDSSWEMFGRADFTYEDDWYPQDDNLARIQDHTYTNLRFGLLSDRYALELWVKNVFEEDDATASFRDVFFGNTDNIYGDRAPGNYASQFFPFRYTVNYPTLRTWGLTVRARFGGD